MNLTTISVVIPCHNEAGNLIPLVQETIFCLKQTISFEIILVDDGSMDSTYEEMLHCVKEYPMIKAIRHRHQCGQSTALRTGIEQASYDLVVTMDGDGQNNPSDILLLLKTYSKHFQDQDAPPKIVVFGNRYIRRDSWSRRMASKGANIIRRLILGDTSVDTGCSLKLFPRQAFLNLPLFDHFHRFLPVLFQNHGFHVLNVMVGHRPRTKGKTKYTTLRRAIDGLVDLFGVLWLKNRLTIGEILTIDNQNNTTQPSQEVLTHPKDRAQ